MKKIITLFIILLALAAPCRSDDTLSIASFNIQIFGKAKAKKEDVMKILVDIITKYDVIAIQEIRDKSGSAIKKLEKAVDALGTDYNYIIGPRLGRSRSKEQYAYIYRVDAIEVLSSYTFDDSASNRFHREPFIARFKAKRGNFSFVLINIHSRP